jgi:hypothetical protein
MGHANPGMVATVYQHLAQDQNYLLRVIDSRHGGQSQSGDRCGEEKFLISEPLVPS